MSSTVNRIAWLRLFSDPQGLEELERMSQIDDWLDRRDAFHDYLDQRHLSDFVGNWDEQRGAASVLASLFGPEGDVPGSLMVLEEHLEQAGKRPACPDITGLPDPVELVRALRAGVFAEPGNLCPCLDCQWVRDELFDLLEKRAATVEQHYAANGTQTTSPADRPGYWNHGRRTAKPSRLALWVLLALGAANLIMLGLSEVWS